MSHVMIPAEDRSRGIRRAAVAAGALPASRGAADRLRELRVAIGTLLLTHGSSLSFGARQICLMGPLFSVINLATT